MDFPCLLGRTLNGLTVLVKSPDGVNCSCLSVRLAACLFDSPAALYLFVSARICSPPSHPQILNLLLCSKPLHFISLAPPRAPSSVGQGSGHPSAQTGGTACPLFFFWHVLCVTLIRSGVYSYHNCACHLLLEHSKQQQRWSLC